MLEKIKNKIEKEFHQYLNEIDSIYSLSDISPILYHSIKEFCLRKGKRLRPVLFIISYLGYSGKETKNLYRSAISIELLHNFMLIHDDIIDKSDMRRGKPSMHIHLNKYIKDKPNIKFNGQDLAIVIADVIYALSIHSFLLIQEDKNRKEEALKKIIEAAIYTGSGEFLELISGIEDIENFTLEKIYKIYDLKTAIYTFATPLAIGGILAGATKPQIQNLYQYGIYLGRAFQIKDDIIGLFGEQEQTGKPNLTDIKEAKKTILIWYAYNHGSDDDKNRIKNILYQKNDVGERELEQIRKIVINCGALDYAEREIKTHMNKSKKIIKNLKMDSSYKNLLENYSQEILNI